jgi:Flp pilus assembly protein TadD
VGSRGRALRPLPGLDLYAATLLAKSGDVDGAIARMRALQEKEPENAEFVYSLGLIQAEGGRAADALASMQRALELDPNHASALNYIGYSWAERGERLDEAERMIARALELRPDDGYITDSLGWVLFMRARAAREAGREAEAKRLSAQARERLLHAEKLTGGDPVISEHIGDVDLFDGNPREALRRYEESLATGLRPNEQPELAQKLERLRAELR